LEEDYFNAIYYILTCNAYEGNIQIDYQGYFLYGALMLYVALQRDIFACANAIYTRFAP